MKRRQARARGGGGSGTGRSDPRGAAVAGSGSSRASGAGRLAAAAGASVGSRDASVAPGTRVWSQPQPFTSRSRGAAAPSQQLAPGAEPSQQQLSLRGVAPSPPHATHAAPPACASASTSAKPKARLARSGQRDEARIAPGYQAARGTFATLPPSWFAGDGGAVMWKAALLWAVSSVASPSPAPSPSDPPLSDFAVTPAPVGAEGRFLDEVAAQLPDHLATERDGCGSLLVRCGPPGSADGPVRLLIAVGVDESGYVVSQIRDDGYLRVRALGAPTPPGDFHLLREGRPARVWTRVGMRAGVLLVDSVHFRNPRPEVLGEEHMYLDVGADSPEDVAALGVELLDPVVQHEVVALLGGPVSAPAAARRAAALVMLRALRDVPEVAESAGLAFAFVAQSTVGSGPLGRGGEAVLRRLRPDEVLVLRGAGDLDEAVHSGSKLVEAQGSHWRPLELRVDYAGTPVEQVEPDDVEALFKALLQEVVYDEAREDDRGPAAAPPGEPESRP